MIENVGIDLGYHKLSFSVIIMCMNVAVRKSRAFTLKSVNLKQDLFCNYYACDPECMGNGSYAYMKAYQVKTLETARTGAKQLLDKPEITARINEYLSQEGFNNENVDKQLLYVVNQHKDLHAKIKGVQEYNKLKKRIDNSLQIILPKPLMELDDDEVIHKIDKSKAREVSNDGLT